MNHTGLGPLWLDIGNKTHTFFFKVLIKGRQITLELFDHDQNIELSGVFPAVLITNRLHPAVRYGQGNIHKTFPKKHHDTATIRNFSSALRVVSCVHYD